MKKKGLIVATIVMVLVLAVSLTTATYAWFNAASTTIVEGINFSVGADTDVLIGVKQSYKQNTTGNLTDVGEDDLPDTPTAAQFVWGNFADTDYSYSDGASTWANGTPGLGHYINTGLDLQNLTQAVGTSVDLDTVADTSWNATHKIIKASADEKNDQVAVKENMAYAVPQSDYLDIVFGAQAAKTDLTGINCVVTVNPGASDLVLGMNAAIHVRWSFDGINYFESDVYSRPTLANATYDAGTKANAYGTLLTGVGTTANANYLEQGISVNAGYGAIIIALPVTLEEGTVDTDAITMIHLQVYIAGYDTDCNNDALGVSSEILVNFVGVKATP